jgi:hypothetical protein
MPLPPEGDDLSRGMDAWQLETAARLTETMSRPAAWNLAQSMRWDIEIGLRKPGPLVVVTGI